jgi:metal-responsive CopG/Arc/MetJ family transcriptional regulator
MAHVQVPMVTISATVPAFVAQSIDNLAREMGMTRSEFIRELLRDCAALNEEILREDDDE